MSTFDWEEDTTWFQNSIFSYVSAPSGSRSERGGEAKMSEVNKNM
jgi:hypothetical protein